MKQRINVVQILLIVYEAGHAFFILTVHPEFSIQMLPYSWYASIPLLALPVILSSTGVRQPSERFLYAAAKFGQLTGSVWYIFRDLPYALNGTLNNWYSLTVLTGVVLFSLIDAILFIVFIIPRRGKTQDADNSNSQR